MLLLLSPAKSLDYETPLPQHADHTLPQFIPQSTQLIDVLRRRSQQDIASLMGLSDKLAALNVARYQAWQPLMHSQNARQAIFAFNGDVYEGLQAYTLAPAELRWAQTHIAVLSGLYGVLRPLDLIQPYRLEMGTALAVQGTKNLYQFWGTRIAEHLNNQLRADTTPVVINLASQEYFKAVHLPSLKARTIDCVFEDWKDGVFKTIGFHAKRARGLMARYAIAHRIATPGKLQGFNLDGYGFCAAISSPARLVFRRKMMH